MKFEATYNYLNALSYSYSIIFDDTLNLVDFCQGVSSAYDILVNLNYILLVEESQKTNSLKKWEYLKNLYWEKQLNKNLDFFLQVSFEQLRDRVNNLYNKFPIIKKIDESPCGIVSVYNDDLWNFAMEKGLVNFGFAKCNDLIDAFNERKIELLQLYDNRSAINKDPEILKNEIIKRNLAWLIEEGFIGKNYEWRNSKIPTKRKLAYLCYRLSEVADLGKNERIKGDKIETDVNWQPFEELFKVQNLRYNFSDLKKEHTNLEGIYPDIDKFF